MQFLIYKQILQSQICINDCDFSTRIFPEWIVTALRTVKITESFKKNWYKGEKNENGIGNNGSKKFSHNRSGIETIKDLARHGDSHHRQTIL